MQFISFQNQFSIYPVFSLQDVRKVFIHFSYRQFDRWEKKGYLEKLKRGFYCFSTYGKNQDFLFYAANKIYSPSYVSLEMALKHYGLIPEEIFQVTSVSTKKTVHFNTLVGNFSFRRLKPSLYWGYQLLNFGLQKILMAEPEKAFVDYYYFVDLKLRNHNDRLNARKINKKIALEYAALFKRPSLLKLIKEVLCSKKD